MKETNEFNNSLYKLKALIACNLKALRVSKGWGVKEASKRLGIKVEKLVLMEQGYSIRSISNLYKIARAYNVKIIDLLS